VTFSPGDARPGSVREAGVRTFLIADVRGYTRFTDERGDEAAARLARRFADLAAEGVSANGGDVVELRGDEVLAVFVSARAALHAAVELQIVFRAESAAEPDVALEVGIGLDAGEAVPVGDGFRGGALNLAARLCGQAGAGEVLSSQGVVHLARAIDGIRYEALEPLILKGLAEPVHAFRVSSVDEHPIQRASIDPGRRSDDHGELPSELDPVDPLFVGRAADLAWLHWTWRMATLRGGRVATLTGPTGMGKTRLAAELAIRLHRDRARTVYSPGNGGSEVVERAIKMAATSDRPTLVVLDDLDLAGPQVIERLAAIRADIATRPVLVVATVGGDPADPRIRGILDRLDPTDDRRRRLRPLDEVAVREIAGLYAGDGSGSLPADAILATTGGVPLEVHRATSAWATLEASRRLETSAGRTSVGRSDLRTVEAELAADIVDLQLARERARLIDPDAPDGGEVDGEAAVCPFKGLAPFETADADYFFGRERLVAELIARLVGTSLLGVIGPSGSGKSSVVRAGLLPALATGVLPGSQRWRQVVMRPGEDPAKELERALTGRSESDGATIEEPGPAIERVVRGMAPTERLLLVVDQFEEIFTTVADETERVAFIDALTTAAARPDGRVVVVVTIRADLYGRCSAYPRLSRALAASQVLVGLLGRDELRRAIELPARRAGLRVEPDLVAALVDEVVDQPGGLPLLSTTLLELWQLREGRSLRMASFDRIGGVRGSVARLAEAAYQRLTPDQRSIARSSLLRLAGPGEGDAAVRRRAPLAEFDVDRNADAAEVLRVLTNSRLITTSEGTVEVAHEALLREWPRLVDWLEEDAQGHQVQRHLIEASKEWAGSERDPAELYRGARLASALEWTAAHPFDLNELEREFIAESRAASEREIDRQRRTNRRLRFLLVGASGSPWWPAASQSSRLAKPNRPRPPRRRSGSRPSPSAWAPRHSLTRSSTDRSSSPAKASTSTIP
jgi:class 3 adenylate cyclase